jgi:transposase InsO family protein
MQVFLQATLDDASRLIPHAQFYPNQGLDWFLDCLRQAIAARGVPTRLYMDNAKIYRSPQLARIAASIGILIIHTPPYQPEGRGKIERFFRSVREQFLAGLDPQALLSIEQLNERLWHWLDTVYHRHEHSALQTTPPHLAGQRIEVRFDPLDLAQLEIYCEGQPEGVARLVDVVVNGRTYR